MNATDPSGSNNWNREVYSFTTESAPNLPPVFSNEVPLDGSVGVPVSLSELSIDISDPEGDGFNWIIETSPDVGSSSGSGEFDGSKVCGVSGLSYGTTYTWFVNATDPSGSGSYTRDVYTFTTKYEVSENTAGVPVLSPIGIIVTMISFSLIAIVMINRVKYK